MSKEEPLPRYLPADVLDCLLVKDWLGPVCWENPFVPGGMQVGMLFPGGVLGWVTSDGITVDSARHSPSTLRGMLLDAYRPEVMHRVVDVLTVGIPCGCPQDKEGPSPACPRCHGREFLRCPFLADFLPGFLREGEELVSVEGPRKLAQSAALLVRSVERIAAGLPPVRGVLPVWTQDPNWPGHRYRSANSHEWACMVGPDGWAYAKNFDKSIRGKATGARGEIAADRVALLDGLALQEEGGGLRLPPRTGRLLSPAT